MKHYILNYILNSQMTYPSISKSPVDVLTHLLFCNGNGCDILNGEFITNFNHGQYVPYSVMYKHMSDSGTIIEDLNDRCSEHEIQESFDRGKDFKERIGEITGKGFDAEKYWEECVDEFYNRYDSVDLIDNYSLKDLQDVEVLSKMLKDREWAPYLQLSTGYYKAEELNKNSDKELVKVTITLAQAYINVLTYILEGGEVVGKNPLCVRDNKTLEPLYPTYSKDIKELSKLIKELKEVLE